MDFHCHLDLYPDARTIYEAALDKAGFVWLVTTSPRAYSATARMLPATEKLVVSPGLHPEIAERKAGELDLLLSQIEETRIVGEVGIDGSQPHRQTLELQRTIFEAVVRKCASEGGRVLSIHSRSAAADVLDTLERHPGFGAAVLHWFTDSGKELVRAEQMGCWFSVGPAMLESANGRKLAALMPRDRVVPESDGPFAKLRGAAVMPWQALDIVARLSEVWQMQPSTVARMLGENGTRLIGEMTG